MVWTQIQTDRKQLTSSRDSSKRLWEMILTHPEDEIKDEERVLDAQLPAAQSRHPRGACSRCQPVI